MQILMIILGFVVSAFASYRIADSQLEEIVQDNKVLAEQTEIVASTSITSVTTPDPTLVAILMPTAFESSVTPTEQIALTISPSISPTTRLTATNSISPSPTLTLIPTRTNTPTITSTPTQIILSPTPTSTLTLTPTLTPTPISQPNFTSEQINGFMDRFGGQYGVDPNVLRHIAICESGFNPKAVNGPYAGLFQFSSATWSSNRLLIGEDTDSSLRYNAEEATQTAAYMLSQGKGYSWPNCLP